MFPKIARPCPYLDRLDQVMDGDFCRMCERTVTDLTAMDTAERAAFMAACGGDACISYTTRLSPAVAAAALAASAAILVPAPALAQRHKAKVSHPRPVQPVEVPPLYFLAGAPPPMPVPQVQPPPPPAGDPPRDQPAVGDRRPEAKPE